VLILNSFLSAGLPGLGSCANHENKFEADHRKKPPKVVACEIQEQIHLAFRPMAPTREVVAKPLNVTTAPAYGLQVITTPASPSAAKQGNQGTALVVRKLTSFPSSYASAPSGKPSSCNTAYFRCAPRDLIPDGKEQTRLRIRVLERHPYTRQAFFPMGRDFGRRAYVVIVTDDEGTFIKHVN
jgi:allantoicase